MKDRLVEAHVGVVAWKTSKAYEEGELRTHFDF